MNVVSSAEMREIDRLTTSRYGVPSLTLMENAGSAVARFVVRRYPDARRITVVCGKGNNGGDGFVAARKLQEAGREVRVVLLTSVEEVKGDAGENLSRLPITPILLNAAHCPVISVDLPSGADADSFALDQPHACRSDAIVTFTAPKPAIVFGTLTRGAIA